MREKARRGERSSERDSKHDDRSEGSEEGSGCVGTQRAIRGLMAAGVGPSSTVARQTPVRKHVNGGSTRALAPTSSHRRPTGRIFFQPSRQRVREFGPLIRHPRSRALSRTPTGMDVVLPVTIVGAGFFPVRDATSRFFFFLKKKFVARTNHGEEPRNGLGQVNSDLLLNVTLLESKDVNFEISISSGWDPLETRAHQLCTNVCLTASCPTRVRVIFELKRPDVRERYSPTLVADSIFGNNRLRASLRIYNCMLIIPLKKEIRGINAERLNGKSN